MNFDELVFEASQFRSEILKEVDQNFTQIKKDKTDLAAKKALVKNIKDFSGIKDVIITFKKEYYNVAVIPIYNQLVSTDLLNVFKDYEAGENIKSLTVVEEPTKYIKKVYIIIGNEIVDKLLPRELTAIILHELGHCFTYTANLPRVLLAFFQKYIGRIGLVLKIPVLWFLKIFVLPAFLISTLIIITVVRSLTFLEHKSEYKADQFATKYGYGEEMIKVLHKIYTRQVEREKYETWQEKLCDFMKELFSPPVHPVNSRRIEEVNDQMLNEYKKLYPKLSNELSIILKDIKS
jgi:hypothetical protein